MPGPLRAVPAVTVGRASLFSGRRVKGSPRGSLLRQRNRASWVPRASSPSREDWASGSSVACHSIRATKTRLVTRLETNLRGRSQPPGTQPGEHRQVALNESSVYTTPQAVNHHTSNLHSFLSGPKCPDLKVLSRISQPGISMPNTETKS